MAIADTARPKPSGFLTFVWALFFFFVFALLVMIWVRASGQHQGLDEKRAEARKTKLAELEKADNAKLTGVGWVDQAKGIVRLPIADAKRLAVTELKSKKPVMSQVKVEPPLPMPPPADPNATEPPPPALPSSPQGADTLRFDLPPAGAIVPGAAAAPIPGAPAAVPAPVAPPGAVTVSPPTAPARPAPVPAPQAPAPTPPAPAPARPPLINPTNAQ
jgi:hypothetical protein